MKSKGENYYLVRLCQKPQCRALWEVGLDVVCDLTKAKLQLRVKTTFVHPCGTERDENLLEGGMLLSLPVVWKWALAQPPCSAT